MSEAIAGRRPAPGSNDDQRSRRRFPIHQRLSILLGTVAALSLLLPAAGFAVIQSTAARERALADQTIVAQAAARRADTQIENARQTLDVLSRDPDLLAALAAGAGDRAGSKLAAMAAGDPDLAFVDVLDPAGRPLAAGGSGSNSVVDWSAVVSGAVVVGPPVDAAERPHVPLFQPVLDGSGRAVAVLRGGLSLSSLSPGVRRLGGGPGDVSLLTRDFQIVADPATSRLLSRLADPNAVLQRAAAGETVAAEATSGGTDIVLAAAPLARAPWIAVAEVASRDVYGPLRMTLSRTLAAAFVIFAVATGIGIAAARWLTDPVRRLQVAVREVAAGKLDTEMPTVRTGDELEELADDLGVMAANLRDAIEDLRIRVTVEGYLRHESESRQLLKAAVLGAIDEAVLFADPDRRVVIANARLRSVLNLDPDRLVGRTTSDIAVEFAAAFADPAAFANLTRGTARDHRAEVSAVLVTAHGREVAFHTEPVSGPDGYVGRLYVFRDVTHERAVDRMKTEFVSQVSHELRTPMTAIKGYVDLILAGEVGDTTPEQREFLGVVQRNTERLSHLIDNVLDIARIEAGRVEPDRVPLAVGPVIEQSTELFRPLIEAKQQKLRVDVEPGLPLILADGDLVIQILTNLISNANKYTPAGGEIVVGARRDGERLAFTVADTGIGLSEADQASLFQRFFRSRSREAEPAGGTGLGLSIARSLTVLQGGDISVRSALGAGTTFTVSFPVYAEAVQAA